MEATVEAFPSDQESVNFCSEIPRSNDSIKVKPENTMKTRTCTYFYNYGYCKFGNSCKYKHFRRVTESGKYVAKSVNSSVPHNMRKHKQIENGNILRISNKQTSSKQNCRYFRMGACKKEENCEFLHSIDHISNDMTSLSVSLQSEKSAKKVFSSSRSFKKKSSTPVCHYFKKGLCSKGDNCKFYHQNRMNVNNSESFSNFSGKNSNNISALPIKNVVPVTNSSTAEKTVSIFNRTLNVYDLSSLTSDVITQLRSTEICQLKKRFPHFEVISDNQTFSIVFQPSDPDWAFDLNKLNLEVDFPVNYPTEECKIIVQSAENVPHLLIKHLNKSIFDWIHGKLEENAASNKTELIFRPFLKWFDKNLEDLFITGLRKVKQDIKAKEDGIEFVPVEDIFSSPSDNSVDKCTEQDTSTVNSSEMQEQTSVSDNKKSSKMNQDNKPSYYYNNNGMKVILNNLEFIEGAAAFICTKISITLQCCRCKTSFNMKSVPKRANSHVCTKCSKNVGFTFEPCTVHQFSSVLGSLHLLDCVAVDINLVECHFLVDCLNCSKQVPVDGIHYGQKYKMWCVFCNAKMLMSIGSVKFQTLRLTSISVSKYPVAKKIEKKSKDPIIKEGEPLPNFGACKHYKKSFRWLRFPCCGRLYPCDECHNEKETDHEMKYASRMICGFCAKEQPYSQEKPCLLCSQSLTRKSGSHWEGGKGCRNRIQMSREDKQKYSGACKTISKKAQSIKPKKKH